MRSARALFGISIAAAAIGLTTSATAFAEPEYLPTESFTAATTITSKFVSKNGLELKCTSATGSGSFTSNKLGTYDVLDKGCTGPLGVKCTSLDSTEVGSKLKKGINHVWDDLEPFPSVVELFEPIHWSCGSILTIVQGCLVGKTTTAKSNQATWTFKQSKGVNEITDFNKEGTSISCFLEASTSGGKFEQSGEEQTLTITFNKGVEVEIMG